MDQHTGPPTRASYDSLRSQFDEAIEF